jgi:simple sugar transport system permease protein
MWWYRGVSFVTPLMVAILALNAVGNAPGGAVGETIRLTFGTRFGVQEFTVLASPLILTGAAVAVGLRANLWNVGADGQLFAGAWAATAVAYAAPHLVGWLLIPLLLITSAVGGILWILIPALLRAYIGVSEILTTLMFNFVAYLATDYFATGPWRNPQSIGGAIMSRPIQPQAWLSNVSPGGWSVSVGLVIALACVVGVGIALRRSLFGYRAMIIGTSARAAAYAGMNVRRTTLRILILSGAVAGLAGGVELLADVHSFSSSLSNDTGFIGIGIGVLAGGSFLGVSLIGVVIAAVLALSESAQIFGVPSESVFLIIGAMLLATAMGEAAARYRLVRRAPSSGKAPDCGLTRAKDGSGQS